ncbi:MarR family winged helix-turn-helix transcriptional regulator [Arthrobacter sp. H41]|uniref:MarR family winged helix-turn-helix transcriptional regulator n=1 Tax=Arthrobacter sp. H41 TaxID=1312978 RepID=UPI00047BDF11|nr:MarR family transcriptional regulator [Arthrobacter sp. H41]
MDNIEPDAPQPQVVDPRALAVALIDISSDVRRKSHEGTKVPLLPNGVLDILRVIEDHPGITVAEVASRLDRQLSNVSTQLRELVARGLVTRTRDAADKRYVTLHPTTESLRIKTLLEAAWAGALAGAASELLPAEQAQIQESLPALQRLASILGD